MKASLNTALLTLALLVPAPAVLAQTSSPTATGESADQINRSGISQNPGLGQDKPKEEIQAGESNAVTGLGANQAGQSAPAAMAKDCLKNPAECSQPVQTGTTSAPPGMPQQSK